MNAYGLVAVAVLAIINVVLLVLLLRRAKNVDEENLLSEVRRVEESVRDEFSRQRDEAARAASTLREEVSHATTSGLERLLTQQGGAQQSVETKLEVFRGTLEGRLREFGESSDTRSSTMRRELNDSATQTRIELKNSLADCSKIQREQLTDFAQRLDKVGEALNQQFDKVRQTLDAKLNELQAKNEQKLEEMRRTVDEKLEGTLEKRLGESFKLVSERLDQVHRGLGEMQAMASNVGDLKRVLTNVKVRGTWGEVQLGALLEQMLTREQYATNVAPKPGSGERVEFAVRLPGSEPDGPIWLPIDAKFPQEDYQRLCEASERADFDGVATAGKALEARLRGQAKDIHDKYIAPPYTPDFAILFLASEGLYAEALRRPGLADRLQREHRVILAGPTTLAALLNSLQMGFRTLAIQQCSSEVWKILGAVKTEFSKFGEVLSKVKRTLDAASNQIEDTEKRTRAIDRTLRRVESLPAEQAARLLPETLIADAEEDEVAAAGLDLTDVAATQRRLGL